MPRKDRADFLADLDEHDAYDLKVMLARILELACDRNEPAINQIERIRDLIWDWGIDY